MTRVPALRSFQCSCSCRAMCKMLFLFLSFEMMSANKWVKVSKTNTTGTQTDPVSVSLKSRREMGFNVYPKDVFVTVSGGDPEISWMEEYWEPR